MQVALQMVGVHKNANITIKGVKFVNGKAMVYGADELVGNICRYLEAYGAFQPHEAERRQAILDGEGEKGSIRVARRRMQRLQEEMAKAQADLEAATEAFEDKMVADEAADKAARAAAIRDAQSSVTMDVSSGAMEDSASTEDGGSRASGRSKGSKS